MIDIVTTRLHNHLLSHHDTLSAHKVVQHLLCMQSQDRNQHLWAIASRAGCTVDDIIQSYNNGRIVRNRTQRGTIHVVSSEDVGWMTQLCASKTISGFKKRREYLGITDQITEQALHHIEVFLSSGPKLRKDIGEYLSGQGIPMQTQRNYHLLCYAGTLGLIVQGPIIDGEQAFVLTSQWIKNTKHYDEKESVRQLCLRYFSSHGPATIDDLQRWSGLGKTVLKQGISDCAENLQSFEVEGKIYYTSASCGVEGNVIETSHSIYGDSSSPLCFPPLVTSSKRQDDAFLGGKSSVHFLAGFDERLLGYKDRSSTVHTNHLNKIDVSRNGVFKPTVMIDGTTLGIWSIKHKTKVSEITITGFDRLSESARALLQQAVIEYSQYIAKEVKLSIV